VFGSLHMSKWPDISKSELVDERIRPRHSREAGIAAPDLARRAWLLLFSGILQRHFRGQLPTSRVPIQRSRVGFDCSLLGEIRSIGLLMTKDA
jgi:hypothetical protein